MDKKNAKWKSLKDFQSLVVSLNNPLVVSIERQVTSDEKVTLYWEEESSSSLFDESETYKVSLSVKLAELLKDANLITKESKTSVEADFISLLEKKIAERKAQAEHQD